jgi:purine nucleoside permease
MGAFVPSVHAVEQGVTLVHHQHGPFNARVQLGASDHHGNFNQSFDLWVQASHFAINPNQILVGFGQAGRRAVRVVFAHGLIVPQDAR